MYSNLAFFFLWLYKMKWVIRPTGIEIRIL